MKNKKILLINPWIYDFAAFDLWVKPLGFLYIDAVLKQNGYETYLIDCLDRYHPELLQLQERRRPEMKRYGTGPFHKEFVEKPDVYRNVKRRYGRYGITEEIFRRELQAVVKPDVVLVTSGMTYWYPGPFRVIQLVREYFPGIPILLGGIYATLCPDHAKEYSKADHIIIGEGEGQALQFVDEVTGRDSQYRPTSEDLDSYPWPNYESVRRLEWMPLLTSRGCPYTCSYCASHRLSGAFRQRDPFKVVEEIEYAYRRKRVRTFVFYDDALLVNATNHISPLLDEVIKRGFSCTFHTPNGLHPREIDRELAERMFSSGFRTVRLSFETANVDRQREMGSKVTNEDIASAIENLKVAGYEGKELEVYVMAGLPVQSLDEMVESVLFVAAHGAKTRLALYSPIPGTREWDKAVSVHGFDPKADPLLHNNSIHPFCPPVQTEDSVEQVQGLVRILNTAIDQGTNFVGPSTLSRAVQQTLLKWAK